MAVALALLVGLATGALVAFLVLVRPALAARDRRAADAVVLERELAAAEARLQASEASLGDRVREAVRDASADAYRQANTDFLELAGTKLEGTVAPLRESLTKVNDQVEALDRARAQSYGALRQQVEALSERAGSLANALRSSNVRGRWGEAQLRNVVEQAGLLEHCDFVAQASARDGEGDLLRPDLVVRIPGGKSVVVDAKVPLAAYLDAFETQDESARHELLGRHARQVRDHVTKLAGKAYQRQFAPAPDFVVMFVPDETLLRVAHEHDTRLSEDARASRVMLASPTTLMAIITTVAAIWQQETVAESARAVHSLGTELHKRLGTFAGHLARTGRALESAVGSYNEAVGSFESRVLVQARKLEQHGIAGELASPQQVERQARAVAAELDAEPHAAERSVVELPRDAHAA